MGVRVVLTWLALTAELLIFGTAAFALTLRDDHAGERDWLIVCLIRYWRGLGLVALTLSPLLFVTIASGIAQTSALQTLHLLPAILTETHAGHVWESRLPIAMICAVASWLPFEPTVMALVMLLASGGLLLCEGLTSHAIDRGIGAAIVQFVHNAAGALWIGAVLGLWFGAIPAQLGKPWVARTAPWVSRLAGWTVAALLLSGLYTTYYALTGEPSMLLYAAYGRVLLVKISVASTVLLIGAYNRFMVIPNLARSETHVFLLRNVAVESILLIGVVALAALLANTPPTHR